MITAKKRETGRRTKQASGLQVLIKRFVGLPMEEALARANMRGLVLASNRRISDSLSTDEWKQVSEGFPCWTGTIVGYEEPDRALDEFIQYMDPQTRQIYAFPVPAELRGRKNIALVAEHPNFSLSMIGRVKTVLATHVGVIEDFPTDSGWYAPDLVYGIPHGPRRSDRVPAAMRILRHEGSMVGLIVREGGTNDIRQIGLRSRPSYPDLGVVIDASQSPIRKKTRITNEGVIIAGLTVAEFSELLDEAKANYDLLAKKIPSPMMQGIKKLLDALKLK